MSSDGDAPEKLSWLYTPEQGGGGGEQFQVVVTQEEEAVVDSVCTQLKVSCSSTLTFGPREGFAIPMGPRQAVLASVVHIPSPPLPTTISSVLFPGVLFVCSRLTCISVCTDTSTCRGQQRMLGVLCHSPPIPVRQGLGLQVCVEHWLVTWLLGSRLCSKHS